MRKFLFQLRSSFQRFMTGRYGTDQLNTGLLIFSVILEVIYSFTHLYVISLFSMAVLGLCIFRMFSKNITKRYEENRKVMKALERLKMRKDYHIYRCKNCNQRIRVPRKGGKRVEIRCPKCGKTFIKKI